jgi:hypothetical protein
MCLWDAETQRELALDASDVGQAVRGFVPKHSRYYFEEKIAYTRPMLAAGDPSRWDDVAVAHEKLDDHGEALRVIDAKDVRFPGLYTTHANRGTFLARSGRLADGIVELERALVIDPHAHFGRESVQVGLYRYLRRAVDDRELVLREDFLGRSLGALDEPGSARPTDDLAQAILGMMIFGGGDRSSHLWLGLGLTLARESAGLVAATRAVRRAEVLGHPAARDVGIRLSPHYESDAFDDDETFAAGQAEVAQLASEEDERLRAGERAALFGY